MAHPLACLDRPTAHARGPDASSPDASSPDTSSPDTSSPDVLTTDALIERLAGHVCAGRELVRRQRASAETVLSTSIPGLDALIGGGLQRGATLELVGRASSGRSSLLLAMLAAVTRCGEPAALVDRGSMLDPRAATGAGIDLPRLLWVRPRDMRETLASAEIVLETGMPLVVVDLGLPPLEGGRGAEAAWLRLARAARTRRTALVIGTPYRVSGTAAGTVIETHKTRACWHPSNGSLGRPASRLLHSLATRLTLVKCVARARHPTGQRPTGQRPTGQRPTGQRPTGQRPVKPGASSTERSQQHRPVRPGDQEAHQLTVSDAIRDEVRAPARGTPSPARAKSGTHAVA